MFSFHRPNNKLYHLNAVSLLFSYAQLYHAIVTQALSPNTNTLHPVSDDTPEYY